jgi:hypothetical protein
MGDKEGAAPGEIISASAVPANKVVMKFLVDLIASLLLPVCRWKEAEIDIAPNFFKTKWLLEVGSRQWRGFSKAGAHLDERRGGIVINPTPAGLSTPIPYLPSTPAERISQTLSAFAEGCLSLAVGPYSGSTHHRTITPQVRALS